MIQSTKDLLLHAFCCPECHSGLAVRGEGLECRQGHTFPIVGGIPRFVPNDQYVGSFSFEWLKHKTTQLDRFRGDSSSEGFFRQKTLLAPKDLAGKLVLDAGVGPGRFADVMAGWGANVVGIDLSRAVESAQENFKNHDNVIVAQADIGHPPFRENTFDAIVSIGVLHHTPDTRKYFDGLVPLLKPGGTICIWVYPAEDDYITRTHWIPFTNKIPERMYYEWCQWFVPWIQRFRGTRFFDQVYKSFPFSAQGLGLENDILDTFDGYSPRFHGIHSPQEVEGWFKAAGLVDVESLGYHTAVRGRRP